MTPPGSRNSCRPASAAERLRFELERLGIAADVHDGDRVSALLSVWVDLVIWVDARAYWWRLGATSPKTGRELYASHSAEDPWTAARRIARRYNELHKDHPLSALLREDWDDAVRGRRHDPLDMPHP